MCTPIYRQHRLWFGKLKPKPKEETAPLPETPAINAFSKPHSANPPFFNNNNNSSNNNSNQLLLLPQEQLQLQHSNATVEIVGAVNIIATSSSNVTSAVVEKMAEDTGVGSGSKLLDTLPGGGSKGKVNWEDDADELVDWATKQLNFEQIKVLA